MLTNSTFVAAYFVWAELLVISLKKTCIFIFNVLSFLIKVPSVFLCGYEQNEN